MKIVGLITEYNPFHAGHLYHMQQARELTGADYCVVLMSGSFVQRGEPAIFDKYLRTKTALLAGADLVLEIPAAFSTASAHEFAAYGVALLSAIGVDAVVFGSECGQIEFLKQAASALNHESAEFQERLRKGLKAGLTYPQARAKALEMEDTWASVLTSPNNILGIEYLRAAEDLHSPMEFYTISRKGSGYHEDTLADANFPSASAIRGIIRNSLSKDKDLLDILASHLPAVTHPAYTGAVPVFVDDFSELLNAAVLQMQATFSIADLSPELAGRFCIWYSVCARKIFPGGRTRAMHSMHGFSVFAGRAALCSPVCIKKAASPSSLKWQMPPRTSPRRRSRCWSRRCTPRIYTRRCG